MCVGRQEKTHTEKWKATYSVDEVGAWSYLQYKSKI